MANRIVKQTRDWYGVKKSANDVIKRFLAEGQGKTFGEIFQHLKLEGVAYSKKGLHLRLDSLRKHGIIEKKENTVNSTYPVYRLIRKDNDFSTFGWWLNYYIQDILMRGSFLEIDTKTRLRLMTTLIGVYALFAEIQSWKFISKNKSYKENFQIRSSFLSQAIPLLTMTSYNEFKDRLFDEEFVPGMYKEDGFRQEMFEYEKFLKKTFPVEFGLCKKVFDYASEASKILPKINDLT